MGWKERFHERRVSLEEAASNIRSGDLVSVGAIAGFPLELVNAVTVRQGLEHVRFLTGLIMTFPDFLVQNISDRFTYLCLYMGPVERLFSEHGGIEPYSVHFSQVAMASGEVHQNVALLDVSPPNEFGFMCIGPGSSFMGKSLYTKADTVIAQVNPNVPCFPGTDMYIHVDEVDWFCDVDRPLFELPGIEDDPVQACIAELIAERIDDGSTLQLGFGKLANAIGEKLLDKKEIGIHTEFLTPSMIELYRRGVVTGRRKSLHPEKMIAAFCVGKGADYDFLHQNPAVEFYPASYVNDAQVIRKNRNFVSVNNALAVDLTGQVSSESMGFHQYSGTGGQVDFVRASRLCDNGQSYIALKSTAMVNGERMSRISAAFAPGTIVTTLRTDVQYIATEYGIADLVFKSIPERVNQMIAIAHPDYREELARQAVDGGLIKVRMLKNG